MSILIGHASIDENGKSQGGVAGDQTGKEVCTRAWYSKPWDFMAVHPTASVREKHASAVKAACDNDYIGYEQNQRNTLNTQAKAVNYGLSAIKSKNGPEKGSRFNKSFILARNGLFPRGLRPVSFFALDTKVAIYTSAYAQNTFRE